MTGTTGHSGVGLMGVSGHAVGPGQWAVPVCPRWSIANPTPSHPRGDLVEVAEWACVYGGTLLGNLRGCVVNLPNGIPSSLRDYEVSAHRCQDWHRPHARGLSEGLNKFYRPTSVSEGQRRPGGAGPTAGARAGTNTEQTANAMVHVPRVWDREGQLPHPFRTPRPDTRHRDGRRAVLEESAPGT